MEQPTTRRSRTLSLAGAATSIIFVATKHVFCRDESMRACYLLLVAAPASDRTRVCHDKIRLLSRQKYACRDKTFAATQCLLLAAAANDRTRVLHLQAGLELVTVAPLSHLVESASCGPVLHMATVSDGVTSTYPYHGRVWPGELLDVTLDA